ncbi:MAG: 2-amino-4-hydroxy-6-hydroxymethyldihydropteridine diphosphokinase [Propionibacteriaceae bacterium]|jgi:dihydroneopterin aldolase/2-amino-4-hydroxy-6-hydroxymethyldihydropteridine diphosphokinase|nr:2-amino-4-hydroxy-6-hydroxymethyldihydropteridine diphosphokinase [Propionibacteriaceae bacterium]
MSRALDEADWARMRLLDRMEVTGIEAWAHHGVFDFERRDGQLFVVDVAWWQDFAGAAEHDDLGMTTHYGDLASYVVDLVQAEPVDLIETVAARLRDALLDRFTMEYVTVTLHKPHAPLSVTFDDVRLSVTGARDRQEDDDPLSRARGTDSPVSDPATSDSHPPTDTDPQPPARQDPTRPATRQAVFSIGSNIEPRWDYLQFAVTALATTPGVTDLRVSPVYETSPVGVDDHPDYLNAVIIGQSTLTAHALLHRGLEIESLARRVRRPDEGHTPRTLDVDLISVGDEVSNDKDLNLPHPRAHERAFVLRPWLDLDPSATLDSRPASQWLAAITDQSIHRRQRALFTP